mmetsp:Transcript_31384/g.57618  ORF Transcript_31384/g.57618 Transcript_31384/m.57618 type:complete len:553 (+) Transcript_31384:54-1712(+)
MTNQLNYLMGPLPVEKDLPDGTSSASTGASWALSSCNMSSWTLASSRGSPMPSWTLSSRRIISQGSDEGISSMPLDASFPLQQLPGLPEDRVHVDPRQSRAASELKEEHEEVRELRARLSSFQCGPQMEDIKSPSRRERERRRRSRRGKNEEGQEAPRENAFFEDHPEVDDGPPLQLPPHAMFPGAPSRQPQPQSSSHLPSQGSERHGTGECRPCAWFWKPEGCRNGADCFHCHLCPFGELKARKRAKAVLKSSEEAARVMNVNLLERTGNAEQVPHAAAASSTGPSSEQQSPYFVPMQAVNVTAAAPAVATSSVMLVIPKIGTQSPQAPMQVASGYALSMQPPSIVAGPICAAPMSPPSSPSPQHLQRPLAASPSIAVPCVAVQAIPMVTASTSPGGRGPPQAEMNEGLLSVGSALHASGNCRPCAWFWKEGGCRNGKDCGHCHLCPSGENKARKKRKVRKLRLAAVITTPPVQIAEVLPRRTTMQAAAGSKEQQDSTITVGSVPITVPAGHRWPEQQTDDAPWSGFATPSDGNTPVGLGAMRDLQDMRFA